MLVRELLHGFQFHQQLLLHEKVSKEVAQDCPIFITHLERHFSLHDKALLAQPMEQPVLIHLLHVTVPEILVQ